MRFRLAALLMLALSSLAWATPDPHKWAVVVGVNEYQRTGVSDLKFAVSDANMFAQALVEDVGVPKDQIFLYTTDAKEPGEMPRLTNLVFRLEWLQQRVKPEDTVFFYFAGHGVESEGETFLLMDNADNRSKATLTMSTLNASLLFDLLDQCHAKDTLVVLDACRNDPAAGRGDQDNPMTDTMSRGLVFKPTAAAAKERHLATLFACGVGERSYEWPEKGHGYFTYFLVEGLKAQGKVTLGSLSNFVRDKVKVASAEAGDNQQPTLRYEGPGPEGWVLAQGGGGPSVGSSAETVESKLEKALAENARLKAENARLQAEIQALKGGR